MQKSDNESEPGIDDNETLVLNLATPTTSATFALNMPSDSGIISGSYTLFNSQGDQVGKPIELSLNSNETLNVVSDTAFQYVAFEGHSAGGKGASDNGFFVDPQSLLLDGKMVDLSSVGLGEQVMQSVVETYTHTFDLTASLQDQDGSESLDLIIEGVPAGATLDPGEENDDGSWTLTVDGHTFDGQVTVTAPAAADNFTLTAKAVATERNPGTSDDTVAKDHAEATDTAEVQLIPTASDEQALTTDGTLEGNLLDNVDFGSDGQGANGGLKSLKVGGTVHDELDANGQVIVNNVLGGTLTVNLATGEYSLKGAGAGTTTLQVMAEDADGDEVTFDFDVTSAGDTTADISETFDRGNEGWSTEHGGAASTSYGMLKVHEGQTVEKTYEDLTPGQSVEVSFDVMTANWKGHEFWEESDVINITINDDQYSYRGAQSGWFNKSATVDENGKLTISIEADNLDSEYDGPLYIDNVSIQGGENVSSILIGDDDSAEQFVLDDSSDDVTIEHFDVANDVLDLSDLLDDGSSGSVDDYLISAADQEDDLEIEIRSNSENGSSKSVTLKDVSQSDFADMNEDVIKAMIEAGQLKIDQ